MNPNWPCVPECLGDQADIIILWAKSKGTWISFYFIFFRNWGNSSKLGYTRTFVVPCESRFKKLLRWVLPGVYRSHTWGKELDLGRILRIVSLKHKGPPHSWGRGAQQPEGRRVGKVVFTCLCSYAQWPAVRCNYRDIHGRHNTSMSWSWHLSLPTHPTASTQPPSTHLITMVWNQFMQSGQEESLQPDPALSFYAGAPQPAQSCSFLAPGVFYDCDKSEC